MDREHEGLQRMTSRSASPEPNGGFPRNFKICGHWVSSYKVMLWVGCYVGILMSAWLAERSGISPLRMGAACLACVLSALIGARAYHLLVFAPQYLEKRSWAALWDPKSGGASIFGALLGLVPCSLLMAHALRLPSAVFWDLISAGILMGSVWPRLGCVFNGCCGGRETQRWYGVCLHDTRGIRKRRIPVQFIEIAWWLLAGAGFVWLWPMAFAPGSYALGVLCWYGLGRFWLDPLREAPDTVAGQLRINQVMAGALALTAGGALVVLVN
jgi:phosphatidylglycerol---prolipoprotein diacylglyceryl transferase